MDIEEFSKKMKNQLKEINIDITKEKIEKMYLYMNSLIEKNKEMNLTAITEPNEVISKHFVDSATILKYIEKSKTVVDIGTGAGFPGIPLKILNDSVEFTLVDSLNKRINFLNEVIINLKIKNIKTIHSRVEDFAKLEREQYDSAVSRAVAPLNVLLEYMLPLVKIGGVCICMKGSNIDEIKTSDKALNILGGRIKKIEELYLPETDNKRNIIIIEKIKKTPDKYPRKAGKPSKEPIV